MVVVELYVIYSVTFYIYIQYMMIIGVVLILSWVQCSALSCRGMDCVLFGDHVHDRLVDYINGSVYTSVDRYLNLKSVRFLGQSKEDSSAGKN